MKVKYMVETKSYVVAIVVGKSGERALGGKRKQESRGFRFLYGNDRKVHALFGTFLFFKWPSL